jgi:hypothetical protein
MLFNFSLAKVGVVGSNPIARSKNSIRHKRKRDAR